MNKKLFGHKIKNLRRLNKLTQEKLAELMDMDIRQIARIEAGESLPSVETLSKLVKVFSVSFDELLECCGNTEDAKSILKSDIYDILSLAKEDQLHLIKKLILAVL